MNETQIGNLAAGSLLGLTIASTLYMLGGRSHKWLRRYVASFVLAMTINGTSAMLGKWNPLLLLIYPLLVFGFSLGYGGDTVWSKVLRRMAYAIGVLSAGLVASIALVGNAWWVLPFHAGVALFSTYLGVRNPIHAAAEEVFVCTTLNLGLIAYPFVA